MPIASILGAFEASNRALLNDANRYSISLRSPTSAAMFPRHLIEFLKPSTPVRFINSSSIDLIPNASKLFNRALLDGTNRYSISRRPPTSVAMFPYNLMNFEQTIPPPPVRFVNPSSIELIPGASESSNRALLDNTNPYSISRISQCFRGI
jgi:hypothetical protein